MLKVIASDLSRGGARKFGHVMPSFSIQIYFEIIYILYFCIYSSPPQVLTMTHGQVG